MGYWSAWCMGQNFNSYLSHTSTSGIHQWSVIHEIISGSIVITRQVTRVCGYTSRQLYAKDSNKATIRLSSCSFHTHRWKAIANTGQIELRQRPGEIRRSPHLHKCLAFTSEHITLTAIVNRSTVIVCSRSFCTINAHLKHISWKTNQHTTVMPSGSTWTEMFIFCPCSRTFGSAMTGITQSNAS